VGSIVEDIKVPVTAVSACVRLFVELLLDGPSRVDANDAAAGRTGEATLAGVLWPRIDEEVKRN